VLELKLHSILVDVDDPENVEIKQKTRLNQENKNNFVTFNSINIFLTYQIIFTIFHFHK